MAHFIEVTLKGADQPMLLGARFVVRVLPENDRGSQGATIRLSNGDTLTVTNSFDNLAMKLHS
jgi:hypothetical protein